MDLLFTRAVIASASSEATKDAQCVAELGTGYRAASLLDIQALYRSSLSGNLQFTVTPFSAAYSIVQSASGALLSFNGSGANNVQVACARF